MGEAPEHLRHEPVRVAGHRYEVRCAFCECTWSGDREDGPVSLDLNTLEGGYGVCFVRRDKGQQ